MLFWPKNTNEIAKQVYKMDSCETHIAVKGNSVNITFMRDGVLVGYRKIKDISFTGQVERWYNARGQRHREDDQPAEIEHANGKVIEQRWYLNGKLNRRNGPMYIKYDGDGKIICQEWYKEDELHSYNDQPAEIEHIDETIYHTWYKRGVIHRRNGPAVICYRFGKIVSQMWYINGMWHNNNDQPAIIEYDKNEKIKRQKWYRYNTIYREVGPAEICYDYRVTTRGILKNKWCKDGRFIHYTKVEDHRRFPPDFRDAMRVLPTPISQAIMANCRWKWKFV